MPVDLVVLGAELRYWREAVGLTQTEVAAASGLSVPRVSLLETGKAPNPRLGTLEKISELYGHSLLGMLLLAHRRAVRQSVGPPQGIAPMSQAPKAE